MLSLQNSVRTPHILILAMALMMGSTLPAVAGEEVMTDGVLHIVNGAEPSGGRQIMHLEEVWQAGGEDDEETVFGIINKVLIDDDNNIYLLDAQLSEINVFSADGE